MGPWYDDMSDGDYLSTKIGTEHELTVQKIEKITDKREYDFTKNGTSVGYHYEFHTDKGIVTVNTWAMAKALKEAQVVEGCKIKLAHPEKDKYVVEVLAKDITE